MSPECQFCETIIGPTPNGGVKSTAYYYDIDGNPCEKQNAHSVNIVEYDVGGKRVMETYMRLSK